MVHYDPLTLQKMAESLYAQARALEVEGLVLGVLFGGGLAAVVVNVLGQEGWMLPSAGGALVGAALGWMVVRPRAFRMRVEAQVALCQVQIEENTRRPAAPGT